MLAKEQMDWVEGRLTEEIARKCMAWHRERRRGTGSWSLMECHVKALKSEENALESIGTRTGVWCAVYSNNKIEKGRSAFGEYQSNLRRRKAANSPVPPKGFYSDSHTLSLPPVPPFFLRKSLPYPRVIASYSQNPEFFQCRAISLMHPEMCSLIVWSDEGDILVWLGSVYFEPNQIIASKMKTHVPARKT